MESNNNNPNTNYLTFQESQIEQSDPLDAYAGSPAPNSSQVYEKPSFQNPNPQPQNPQLQMNNYPNYYQNQPPQNQPTPSNSNTLTPILISTKAINPCPIKCNHNP